MIRLLTIFIGIVFFLSSYFAAGEERARSSYSGPGIRNLEFTTDSPALVPGETLSVGLIIEPEPKHHTYWKGPGIVGVSTLIEWDLPEGFGASPILWPVPEKVDMVGITANGYYGRTVLLTEIKIPDTLPKKMYRFEAKVAWMSCSTSCNPGVTRLFFSLPARAAWTGKTENPEAESLFQSVRKQLPSSMPADWSVRVRMEGENTVVLAVTAPGINQEWTGGLEFFCDDMQVNSDKPTRFVWVDENEGTFELRMIRPDFAPSNPSKFSGVIKSDRPWPSAESRFVEISAPWPEGTFPDE